MDISRKLQLLRREKGYSQEVLAEKCEVSRQAVSKWENGIAYPEVDKLILLSKLYEVSVDYLIKDDICKKEESQEVTGEIQGIHYNQYTDKICDITMKSLMKSVHRNVRVISCDNNYVFFIKKGKKGLVNRAFISSILVKDNKDVKYLDDGVTYGKNLVDNMIGKCTVYTNPNGYFAGTTYFLAEIKEVNGNMLKVTVGRQESLINIDVVSSIIERK